MADALGWRCKFGVVVPKTNTIVQPDFDDLRPPGVTNHVARIATPAAKIDSDDAFREMIAANIAELRGAVDRVMPAEPDHLIVGISSVMFWDGYAAATRRRDELAAYTGLTVTGGSFAVEAALRRYGVKRIAILSPYAAAADPEATRFFTEAGFDVVRFVGLRIPSAVAIAEVTEDELRRHLVAMNTPDAEALVQFGTNMSMLRLAAEAERWLGKPVIAINAATYWHALRTQGIEDRIEGFGSLLSRF